MVAFWGLFLLAGYGCMSFVPVLRRWFPDLATVTWIKQFPLLGDFGPATLIALLLLAVIGVLIHRILNRPRFADMLIETEGELRKVTWPSAGETWTGTLAVAITVVVLLAFLTLSDTVLQLILVRAVVGG